MILKVLGPILFWKKICDSYVYISRPIWADMSISNMERPHCDCIWSIFNSADGRRNATRRAPQRVNGKAALGIFEETSKI